jgi:hypothetical protein
VRTDTARPRRVVIVPLHDAHISGVEEATAILSSTDIGLKDLKCNLGQWRYWPSAGKKGKQWGPFPEWSLLRRAVLWHKSWTEDEQRKIESPSRHLMTAISALSVGPCKRVPPVTGDGVTSICTTETAPNGDVYTGITLRLCSTPNITTPPEKRFLDMEFDLIFLDPRLLLGLDSPTHFPEWLWDVIKNRDTICYGDPDSVEMIEKGLGVWIVDRSFDLRLWSFPVFTYIAKPSPNDAWKTTETGCYIWSAKTLPTAVCPVCMFSSRFDMHATTARPRRVVRVCCTSYSHSYRRSSPWAARNERRSRTRISLEGISRCPTCCGWLTTSSEWVPSTGLRYTCPHDT